MRLLTVLAACLISTSAMALDFTTKAPQATVAQEVQQYKPGTVVLDSKNVVLVRGVINEESVSKWTRQVVLSQGPEILVYIDSPGGEVMSGMQLINTLQDSGKTITCVAQFAASMAFILFQSCHNRIVRDTTILMQHQASWGLQGGPTSHNLSFLNFLMRTLDVVDEAQSKRLGLSVKNFRNLVHDDWWMYGQDSIKSNAADKTAPIICTPESTNKTYTEEIMVFIFRIQLTWSRCPLIGYPLEIKMPGFDDLSNFKDGMRIQNEIDKMYNFPRNDGNFIKQLNTVKQK